MVKLDLTIDADSRYPFNRKQIKEALVRVLTENTEETGEYKISLSVVGERKIRELEKKFFDRDEVTDVLSFPMKEGGDAPEDPDGMSLGDIVICYPQAKRQAMQWNKLLDDEIEFLACHGLLHLLGIHHE